MFAEPPCAVRIGVARRQRHAATICSQEGPRHRVCHGSCTWPMSTSAPDTTTSGRPRPPSASASSRRFTARRMAISEKVDLVLICGDLFDSNSQPRRSVERAAAELARLVDRHIPVVLIPGTHDCYEPELHLPRLRPAGTRGSPRARTMVTVLTDTRAAGRLPAARRSPSTASYSRPSARPRARWRVMRRRVLHGDDARSRTWHVGMIHGSMAVPGQVRHATKSSFTEQEVAASGLDYLALGHWHSFREGHVPASTTWAYSRRAGACRARPGRRRPGPARRAQRTRRPAVGHRRRPRRVGRTKFEKLELDAAAIASQADVERSLRERADPDTVLDVRLVGVKSGARWICNVDELERQLQKGFLRLRIRDASVGFAAGCAAATRRHDPGCLGAGLRCSHRRSRVAWRSRSARRS